MKHVKLFESWLNDDERDALYPRPPHRPVWRKAEGEVTEETLKLLQALQPDFHDVSLFSWHPNIEAAQYSGKKNPYSHSDGNYNSRMRLNLSLIAKTTEPKPYSSNWDGFRVIERALKPFPFMEKCGGSGHREPDGRYSTQVQISFLTKGIGTHEKAAEIKKEKITSGAYTFESGEWKFIPVEDFDPYKREKKAVAHLCALLEKIFSKVPEVKRTRIAGFKPLHPRIAVDLVDGGFVIEIKDELGLEYENGEGEYSFEISHKKTNSFSYDKGSIVEGLRELLEATKLFSKKHVEELAKDPENYAQILKSFRGRVSGRDFGF